MRLVHLGSLTTLELAQLVVGLDDRLAFLRDSEQQIREQIKTHEMLTSGAISAHDYSGVRTPAVSEMNLRIALDFCLKQQEAVASLQRKLDLQPL